MASSSVEESISKEEFLKRAAAEYERIQKEAADKEKKFKDFAQSVVVTMRHPEASKHVIDGSYREALGLVSPTEQVHLEKMYSRYNSDQSVKLILSPNKGSPTGSAMGGFLLITSDKTIIQHAGDIVSKTAPFMNVALMELKAPTELLKMTDVQLRDHFRPKLTAFLTQLSDSPPSPSIHGPEEGQVKDKAPWSTFFPRVNASVGVFKSKENKLVLIVRSHAGERNFKELKPLIAGRQAKDVLLLPQLLWVREMSKRNTLRLLRAAAKVIGLKPEVDGFDHCARIPKHHKRVKMAIPKLHCLTNNFRRNAYEEPIFFVDCLDNHASLNMIPLVGGDYTEGYRTLRQTQKRRVELSSMLPAFVDMHPPESRPPLSHIHNVYYNGAHISRCTQQPHQITHHHFVEFDKMDFQRFGRFVGISGDSPYEHHFEPIINVFH